MTPQTSRYTAPPSRLTPPCSLRAVTPTPPLPQTRRRQELHYRVKRQWKNSSIRVNAIVQKPDEGGSTSNGGTVWRFELSTPNDELCDSSSGNAVDREKPGLQLSKTLLALQLDPKKTSPEATEKVCAGADELIYKVGVERFPGAKGEMPFEIQVIEEPPAENADQLPAGVPEVPKDGSSSPAPKGTDTPQPVTGGTSFDDAVELSSGSYAVQVTTNEKVFCKPGSTTAARAPSPSTNWSSHNR